MKLSKMNKKLIFLNLAISSICLGAVFIIEAFKR